MKIQIETTQHVHIEYELASIGDRIVAYLIDFGVIVAYELVMWRILVALDLFNTVTQIVLMAMPFFLYDLISEIALDGRSLGKIARKIKIISLNGRQPALASYLLRWLLRPIDFGVSFGGISIITMILTGKGQRLGDLVGNTAVISTQQKIKGSTTLLPQIDPDYEPTYTEVTQLTDEEIRLIREVLRDFHLSQGKQSEPLLLLTNKVTDFLGIETEEKPFQFLKTVLKDYHHLTSEGWK
ncbi:MAG: RDD family protein [Flammeovirgaceae bacterium]